MHIDKIKINNFKNYNSAEISFSSKINFLYGKNGAGKTNLLDAIYYLSYGKSMINSFDLENINHSKSFFMISGSYSNNKNYKCTFEASSSKKIFENENKYDNIKQHIGKIPLVFINPYDINLIRNYSSNRRRFFDQIFSQTDNNYLENLISYNRLLKQRNAYLKSLNSLDNIDKNHIKSYDENLITLNRYIEKTRSEEIKNFNKIFSGTASKLSNENTQLNITYYSNFKQEMDSRSFDKYLEKDFFTKKTNIGIHNDDYIFEMDKKLIKRVGSQGQQKTFIIALRIAEFKILNERLQTVPIMLLDDVFHKLDDKKINLLLDYLKENDFNQIIISDSIKNRLKKIEKKIREIKIFKIVSGNVYER